MGILLQISDRFFQKTAKQLNIPIASKRDYAVGMFFFPSNELRRNQAKKMFEIIAEKEGVKVLAWREVPCDPSVLGSKARACMPHMVAAKKGVICLVGSVMGMEADPIGAMYGAAKSGLFNFVKSLALAGGPHGVRAVCVSPGPVLTRPGMATMVTAIGRAARPEELVDVILFLCSDAASFVTGANMLVDGGRMCMPGPSAT